MKLFSLLCSGILMSTLAMADLQPEFLRCEYRENPLGIDDLQPRLSWIVTSGLRNQQQTAYHILVASTPEKLAGNEGDLWDSGKISSQVTNQISYEGKSLESRQDCYWKVRVWDQDGNASAWSEPAHWSMGLLGFFDWQARWITHDVGYDTTDLYQELYLPPARYLRKEFNTDKPVKSAKVYATAKGLYELHINGQRVGESYFTPGWTDYNKRVYYNTYDVTDLIKSGNNAIGAIISDGWYSGYLGYALLVRLDKVREFYGVTPSFMGQLEIEYEDGSRQIIASDQSWQGSEGPIREADIIMGETYDARMEQQGWDQAGFNAQDWKNVKLDTYSSGKVEAYPGVTVQYQEEITPLEITEPEEGTYIFDLGKNIAGKARLKVSGAEGTKITLRFGEMLNADGTLMTENLRKARATDTYILKGDGEEVWEPKFTYHGFQYVEVSGLPEAPQSGTITGIVMNSDTPQRSTFECSNPLNNQLYQNILTTQFANYFEVPTDCPQRDERLGWTGDAQIYARSATYNADVAAFFKKWLVDLKDAQRWFGAYPNFAPFPYSRPDQYSPAWMDAGIIIPHTMYQVYGDTRILEELYPSMQEFMAFQAAASDNYLRPGGGNNFGDWLNVGKATSHDFIGSVYYGYDARLMAEMAEALGKTEDARHYQQLFENIKKAFAEKYIKADGSTTEDTQTSYALALYMGLYPEALAELGAARLARQIRENGNKFSTGFLGSKHVVLALTQYGYVELAYALFQQTEYPSWGYSVVNGSTSIWERWNSYTLEEGFGGSQNAAMNSFSHYAYGSIAEWMFMHAAGIDTDGPGYRKLIIKPVIDPSMEYVNASYESINGKISSRWKLNGKKLSMNISIPANTTATVYVPTNTLESVEENGKDLSSLTEIEVVGMEKGKVVLKLGSGDYAFTSRINLKPLK
ncbi:glycoside hydrolase family 78 protein [Catalinimonas sp. 4WD22]|uniref:glycoside hydrolase family 78 protein n=1 Tax=Catalinimonas locisalis TaxID=3133978 RepID=UPI003100A9B8